MKCRRRRFKAPNIAASVLAAACLRCKLEIVQFQGGAMTRILIISAACLLSIGAHAGDRITGKPFATRSEVIAAHGMVATSVPLATQIGLDVLKKDGTAVDAAIAANAALGLMEPVSNGVGGDLFAIVWDAKTKKLYGYN